jgi:hypothetical protein
MALAWSDHYNVLTVALWQRHPVLAVNAVTTSPCPGHPGLTRRHADTTTTITPSANFYNGDQPALQPLAAHVLSVFSLS